MNPSRRTMVLSLLALPAGCAIQPLEDLRTQPLDPGIKPGPVRPPAVGQTWTYRKSNVYNSQLLAIERETVVSVSPQIVVRRERDSGEPLPEERHEQWGLLVRDPAWDDVQNYENPVPLWPRSLEIGTTVSRHTHYRLDNGSFRYWVNVHCAVRGWERVTLAQGEFAAVRIERLIRLLHTDISRIDTVRRDIIWLAPEVGRWVARETSGEYILPGEKDGLGHEDYFRWELTNWT